MSHNNYVRVFNHLSHMVALSKEGKIQAAVDNLILTVFAVNGQLTLAHTSDIATAVNTYFGLSLDNHMIQESVDRHVQHQRLHRNTATGVFGLHPKERAVIEARIREASELETAVREEWLSSLEKAIPGLPSNCSDQLWKCLRSYMAKAFRRHGVQTIQLLDPTVPLSEEDRQSLYSYLEEAIKEHCTSRLSTVASTAVQYFFNDSTPLRSKYVAQLLDGTFTFFALTIDEVTSAYLRETISPLSLFLDTNFIFGVLRLHTNPLNEVSEELVNTIRTNNLPFKLYYHEATLQELQRTISAIADGLKNRQWTQALSRAAMNYGQISAIERQYHQKNANAPIDPKIFLSRYDHITELLNDRNFTIYRSPKPRKQIDDERHQLCAEYLDFLEKRNRHRSYQAVNHDIIVWQAVKYLRNPGASALNAGAFFLTADYSFYSFDWQTLRQPPSLGLVVLPNQFLQLLRPFIPRTEDFDRRFFETFAVPEFRTISSDYSTTYSNVLSFLSTYADMSEETASRLLASEILMNQLREIPEDSEEFRSLVESALVYDNEHLSEQNKNLETKISQKDEQLRKVDQKRQVAEEKVREAERAKVITQKHADEVQAESAKQIEELRQTQAISEEYIAELQKNQEQTALQMQQLQIEQKKEITRIQEERDNSIFVTRLLIAIIFAITSLGILFTVPQFIGWNWFLNHPNRLGLYGCVAVLVVGISWSIGDRNQKRAVRVLSTVTILSIGAMLTILGR